MDFDEILAKCGNSHRYQYLLLGLYSFLMFVAAMHNFSQNVISFVPEHWCHHEQLENLSFSQINAIYDKFESPSCTRLAIVDLEGGTATKSEDRCDRWIYNYDFGFRSMNTELNWVCGATYKAPVGQSFFFVGSMFGTVIFGFLGDRIGRLKALILANWCGFLGDFSTNFTDNLIAFSFTRFLSGLAIDANTFLMYILVVECVSPSTRSLGLSICTSLFYGLGMLCSPWIAVFVGHWRKFLMCTSFPLLCVTLFYLFAQESAQWLITRNDIDGAVKVLKHVAKINRRNVSESDFEAFRQYCQNERNAEKEQVKLFGTFKTPHLRSKMIKTITMSMTISLCFNTIARNVVGLGISPFITLSMYAAVVLPAGVVHTTLQNRFGRKCTAISAMISTGMVTAGSSLIISLSEHHSVAVLVTLSVIAKFGMSICFGATLLFGTELIPTCVRSRGMAMVNLLGSSVAFLSSYILLMGTYYRAGPTIILCVLLFFCAFLCLLLPETSNRKLPITLEEGEQFGKTDRMFDFLRPKTMERVCIETESEAIKKLMS
ncbi:hypothetical protein KR222_004471 [Zaprionus bogoriensis]|nr:hypothetical protein KR222_004471 [Zaprionus bogoriensis]